MPPQIDNFPKFWGSKMPSNFDHFLASFFIDFRSIWAPNLAPFWEPKRVQEGPKNNKKTSLETESAQTPSGPRFWADLGSIFDRFLVDFGAPNPRKIQHVFAPKNQQFWKVLRCILGDGPVVARASREAAQLAAVGHVRKVRLIPRIISQLARTKQNDREHHSLTA